MEKYKTIFIQAEELDTDEAYEEKDKTYKSMNFGEIMNILNEIEEITSLIITNTQEFKLNSSEISAIGNELKFIDRLSDCLITIAQIKRTKNK